MTPTVPDRIEKKILLRAPRARVWKALSDSAEFGTWFGVDFDGPFRAGSPSQARITKPPQYAGLEFTFHIETIEPDRLLSYRWHPGAVDPKIDYSKEPTTLVTFTLEDAPGGTLLTVVESGFDAIPEVRRTETFRLNESGWAEQIVNVQRHVAEG
jgi:uncharacterized protein YndB with AHSA1/START domain